MATFNILDYKVTRWALILVVLCMAAFTDYVNIEVAYSELAHVPKWLQVFNIVWISFTGLMALLAVIFNCGLVTGGPVGRQLVLGTEHTAYRVLIAVLLLPFNTLWFYQYVGSPALVDTSCRYYQDFDGTLMVSEPGSAFPPHRWVDAGTSEIPPQPYCESVMNTIFDSWLGLNGDRWDELYEFILRLFAFSAGVVADGILRTLKGNYIADLSDIFDLFLMSYQNVFLMKEGKRAMRVGKYENVGTSFDWIILTNILVAYGFMFVRLWLGSSEVKVCRCRLQYGNVVNVILSIIQQISFGGLRVFCWYFFEIPISVLLLKNIACLFIDVQELFTESIYFEATDKEDDTDEEESDDV